MQRGDIYYAAVPYLPESPLDFFIEEKDQHGNGTGVGRVEKQLSDNQLRGAAGNPEYKVILPFKRRMVVILSGDDLLKTQPSVIVMPIHTISDVQAQSHPFYQKLINTNMCREAFYLGTRSGKKAAISVIDVKTISKSLVYDKVGWSLTISEMADIDIRFADCLNNSIVLACQVCDRQCNTCDLLQAATKLKAGNQLRSV